MNDAMPDPKWGRRWAPPVVDVDEFLGSRKSPRERRAARKPPKIADAAWEAVLVEAQERMRDGDWEDALPRHFAAMWCCLHELVYGVRPAMAPAERVRAAGAAALMLKRDFAGEGPALADFVRWAWIREQGREKWRRENATSGGRLGWQLLFGGGVLTDYRVERARAAARRTK